MLPAWWDTTPAWSQLPLNPSHAWGSDALNCFCCLQGLGAGKPCFACICKQQAEFVTPSVSRGQTPHISGTSTPSWSAGLARADLDDMAAAYGLGPLDTASQLAQAARSLRMQSSAGQKSVWDQIAELSRTGPSEYRPVCMVAAGHSTPSGPGGGCLCLWSTAEQK